MQFIHRQSLSFLLALFVSAFYLPLNAQIISATTVDVGTVATDTVGQHSSQAVVAGNPAISYYDVTNGDLRFVRANDANGPVGGYR